MDKRAHWIISRYRTGWVLLVAGIVVASVGVFMQLQFSLQLYNYRIITGAGILLAGAGIGTLLRYRAALKDERAARRLSVEEHDERNVLLRTRAGGRAYWVSAALFYAGLMWASFAANGSLPALAGDTLWFFLAAGVLIPFAVYAASILVDQRSL